MLVISRDGVEADIHKQWLLGSQGIELAVDGDLGLSAGLYRRLQPSEKLHQGYAVFQHRTAIALDLGLVLARLHGRYGRRLSHHLCMAHLMIERIAGLGGVEQYVVFKIIGQPLRHAVVVGSRHALPGKVTAHLWGNLPGVTVERRLLAVDEKIGHEHRVTMHVAAPEVERPRHIVECRDQHAVGMLLAQGLSHAVDFRRGRLAGIFQGMYHHLV